ncbi:MAG: helix-turn-helix transcriptional regulator [Erysipelotrichaceae bacterium]|nr:helix-turn-helix transcriptional regulator [Erysipelotrichaceae bacterium]
MNKQEFLEKITELEKLIRIEHELHQDKMAAILGISKKTLVESEKGRRPLGWTEAVALVSIFSDSAILQNAFGGELSDLIHALAFEDVEVHHPLTMGGHVWWEEVGEENGLRVQRNIISGHYRILDQQDARLYSSFSLDEIRDYLKHQK